MSDWTVLPVAFKYQLGDRVLFSRSLTMQVRQADPLRDEAGALAVAPPVELLAPRSQGFVIRALPVPGQLETIVRAGRFIRYVPLQYEHCFIDLTRTFDHYAAKFSSKTRSTINRKVRKFQQHCASGAECRAYATPEELADFFPLAREVSRQTYQERLLDAGLPSGEAFERSAAELAARGKLRAFLLFDNDRAVSYLYCPVKDGVLQYGYLGYRPEYADLSVGTVLLWLALERLFAERRYLAFDFTEGTSSHKQLFATHRKLCANVYFLRPTLSNWLLVTGQQLTDRGAASIGGALRRWGIEPRIRRLLRGTG